MANYSGPVCRFCRREGAKLYLKGERCYTPKCAIERRAFAPGMHGQARKRKTSDYGLQLRAKQKARRIYGLLEKQFRNYFDQASNEPGVTGINLLRHLELRLDNVVYRIGLGTSRKQARQLVTHRHFEVNGKLVNVPSYQLKPGDELKVKGSDGVFDVALEASKVRPVPAWLAFNTDEKSAKILTRPERHEMEPGAEEQQIDGVAHEFTAIPHVKEDVTEVILNLKKLRLKSFTEDPITLLLDVKGPVEVRASHIQATSDVEIVNPDLYICTLAAKGHLRMELNVERGKGYVPAERNKREGQPIGVIPIDSIFSPVEKANFVVEKTRVGQSTDYDRLIIEVWTDGTMSPEEAVSHSAELFTQHLNLFVKFRDNIERHEQDLLALRNFGRKSLDEIKEKLVEKGFIKPEEMGTVLRG